LKRPAPALLYGAIAAMVLFWSANFVVGKLALREFPAGLLAGLRTTFAAAIAFPIYLWRRSNPKPFSGKSRRRPAVGSFLLLGLTGVAANQAFFVLGLSRTSVAHSALLIGLTPVMVLLLAAAGRMEKLTAAKLAGMAIALGGVAVLNASPSKTANASLAGDILTLSGAACFAIFTIISKRVTCGVDGITVTAAAYGSGAIMMAPVTLWHSLPFDYASVTITGWASVLYMAAFPSVVCYLIFYWVLMYIPASRVSAFSYAQPLIATLMAVPVLGESVTLAVAGGGALVLLGVALTERRS
jgi:drug/metabolite transporter (DMT)-like permease